MDKFHFNATAIELTDFLLRQKSKTIGKMIGKTSTTQHHLMISSTKTSNEIAKPSFTFLLFLLLSQSSDVFFLFSYNNDNNESEKISDKKKYSQRDRELGRVFLFFVVKWSKEKSRLENNSTQQRWWWEKNPFISISDHWKIYLPHSLLFIRVLFSNTDKKEDFYTMNEWGIKNVLSNVTIVRYSH